MPYHPEPISPTRGRRSCNAPGIAAAIGSVDAASVHIVGDPNTPSSWTGAVTTDVGTVKAGSAVMDTKNTGGFKTGTNDVIVAAMQTNVKRIVAYSSVAHMGFVMLGLFAGTQAGMEGAVLQMLNHGVSTGALFLLVGVIYDRSRSPVPDQ